MKTTEAVSVLAAHIADGEYTTEELEKDVANIRTCVEIWKEVAK